MRAHGPDQPKPLYRLRGEALLLRQARCLTAAGAGEVLAVVNSETAAGIERAGWILPPSLRVVARDTANSMETLFEIGARMPPGWFVATTVDSVLPMVELTRFTALAVERTEQGRDSLGAVLGVVRWRGDERPLFAEVSSDGAITGIGGAAGEMATAGVYFLSTQIFAWQSQARREGLSALRQFLGGLLRWGVGMAAIELHDVIDIDETGDLEAAERMLARLESPSGGES